MKSVFVILTLMTCCLAFSANNYNTCDTPNQQVLTVSSNIVPVSGGTLASGIQFGTLASGITLYWGVGAPNITANQGSVYFRTDGGGTGSRMYINTVTGNSWAAVTTTF